MANEKLTLTKLAQRMICSDQSIYNWIEEGMPRQADKKFDWPAVWNWWNARSDAKSLAVQADPERYAQAELRKMKADARWKEIKANQLEGKLVEVEYVVEVQSHINANIRKRLLQFPSKLTPQLIGENSRSKISTILTDEIYQTLNELVAIASTMPEEH